MASTKHECKSPQKQITQQNQPRSTQKRELRSVAVTNGTLKQVHKPIIAVSKPSDDRPVPCSSPRPLVTERKTILRHCANSQDSIGARLSTVGPIPACGLDDWKYTQQQQQQQQQQQPQQQSIKQSNPSPAGSFNLLRLPFGNLLSRGAYGSSCASLLVHAPSLSRVSAQTDDEFALQDTESCASSSLWFRKPIDSNVRTERLCPMCCRDQYALDRSDFTQILSRWRSLSALNYSVGWDNPGEPDTQLSDSEIPSICCFHKIGGWGNNCRIGVAECGIPLPSASAIKRAACSISLPNLRLSLSAWNLMTQREVQHSSTSESKVSSNVAATTANDSMHTSKMKCESWLESWK